MKEGVVFLRGLIPMTIYPMTIWKVFLNKKEQNALFNIEEIM